MEDLRRETTLERCKSAISNCFPILVWFPAYSHKDIFGDFVAGISVAMAAIPQSMAYAVLAGIRPQYGLYSSFLGPFVYIFIGSCRQVTVGPTAVSALLAYETCGNNFPDCVVLTAFYAGVIQILLAIFQLGNLVALISDPVTAGFTSGAALTIASSQLKSFFGFSSTKDTKFLGYLEAVFENWSSISVGDVTMGVLCLLTLFALQNLRFLICSDRLNAAQQYFLEKFLWAISVCRNVIVVVTASVVAYFWVQSQPPPFKLIGFVEPGLPKLSVPKFALEDKWAGNGTGTETLTFVETLGQLGSGPALIALVAILQNVAITKAYGGGQRINGNQEMISLGVTAILGGFISAQPVSASFSRSALNDASGVRSQISGSFTGLTIILSLLFFTPAFYFIPRATLAAVIISAVLVMVDVRIVFKMWKVCRIDIVTYAVTFLSSLLFSMEVGIGFGVGCSIFIFLYKFVRAKFVPEVRSDEEDPLLQYVVLRCPQGLNFPDVDALRKYVNTYTLKYSSTHPILVLDCLKWHSFDYTGLAAISSMIKASATRGSAIVLLHCSLEFQNGLKRCGISDEEMVRIVCDNENQLPSLVKKIKSELNC